MKRVLMASFLVLALLMPCVVQAEQPEGQKVLTPAEEAEYRILQQKLLRNMLKQAWLEGCMDGMLLKTMYGQGKQFADEAEKAAVEGANRLAEKHEAQLLRLPKAE